MTHALRGLDNGPKTNTIQEGPDLPVCRSKSNAPAKVVVPLLVTVLFVSVAVGAMAGYAAGLEVEGDRRHGVSLVPWTELNRAGRTVRLTDRFAVLREALDFLEEEYIGEVPAEDVLNQAAIDGVLAELGDRYSVLVRPDGVLPVPEEFDLEGIGIGARLEWLPDRKRLLVTQTFEGLPAADAGLRAGDLVVSVDGEPVSWMGREAVFASLRAPVGTEVRIGYRRDEEAFDAAITLREVAIPTVDHEVLGAASNIGYVRMHSIGEFGAAGLAVVLTDLMDFGVEAMILDLRGTAGGSTEAAVRVAGLLTGPRLVAIGEHTDGARMELKAEGAASLPSGMPLAVLVDRFSAGASELVAGAIQDHGIGLLIGETTYGNGSGQTDFVLGDGSRLRVSDHLWHTPNGWEIHGQGLIPDVPMTNEDADGDPEDAGVLPDNTETDPYLQVAELYLVHSLDAATAGP
ncbi:MAG: PDZ domain-containing protein [Caldilineaceae bacterium SB0662_bin_9]|uniref:PDZ domain-containing protein n=1 Tax=Caldilineaceae bacterium SB0662_bin_9 TaxID=2605258 RepID=A0A6B1DW35_9CHLR|nr:PDZ domain-containing protein [Caldilineaceae bacterium SB0662_bin_9]